MRPIECRSEARVSGSSFELDIEPLDAVIEQLPRGDGVPLRFVRIRRLEQSDEKRRDALRAVALSGDSARLYGHRQDEGDQSCNGRGADRDTKAMPSGEFGEAICRAWRTGEHGQVLQMTTQVSCEIRDCPVAPRPILLERLHRDPVEISAQLADQPRLVRSPIVCHCRSRWSE